MALRYADAICWDPSRADDELWARLHEHFSEPELVELGLMCGIFAGGQRWIHTLDIRHADVASDDQTGYRPELADGAP